VASSSLSVISISIIICQWKRSLLAVSPPRDFILNQDAAIVDYRTPAVQRLRLAWPAWSRELVAGRAVGKSYLSSYFHRKVTLVLTVDRETVAKRLPVPNNLKRLRSRRIIAGNQNEGAIWILECNVQDL
jgi:hypothetical protein